ADGGGGAGEAAQALDEEGEGDDVEDVEKRDVLQEAAGERGCAHDPSPGPRSSPRGGGLGLDLNISSMRSVTRKPPTMLMVPNAMAITRMTLLKALFPDRPTISSPPSRTMPW